MSRQKNASALNTINRVLPLPRSSTIGTVRKLARSALVLSVLLFCAFVYACRHTTALLAHVGDLGYLVLALLSMTSITLFLLGAYLLLEIQRLEQVLKGPSKPRLRLVR